MEGKKKQTNKGTRETIGQSELFTLYLSDSPAQLWPHFLFPWLSLCPFLH